MGEKFTGSQNNYRTEKVLVSEWEGLTKNDDGEPEVTTLHKYEYQVPPEAIKEVLVPPEEELRFRRRKLGKQALKSCETYFIFSDAHIGYRNNNGILIPTHDERSLKLASEIAYDINPDYIVNLGDTVDFADISRWEPDSAHFMGMTQHSIDRAYAFQKEMRESAQHARYIELQGNHDDRIKRMLAKSAQKLLGLKQAGTNAEDIFSYEHLMNLKSLDIEYISGYPAGNFMPHDDIQFRHGSDLKSNGSTAELLSKRYPYHGVIQGHGHKSQTHWTTRPDGHQQPYHMTPILGRTNGVIPGYGTAVDDRGNPVHKQENWQSGISIYQRYPNGASEVRSIMFNDGVAYLDGKEYRVDKTE